MPERLTEIVLVRHGVTAWNKDKRFQGHTDTPLDDEGRRQAALTGARLAGSARAGAPFTAVYSSDLGRAWQTAEPIAAALGLERRIAPGLRERFYGGFEGRTHQELIHEHHEAYTRWHSREPDFELPGGGESLRRFYERVHAAVGMLATSHPGERIVAVTHGGVLDCAYRIASGLGITAPRQHELLNASINRVGWDGRSFSVIAWGDVAHLGASEDDIEARG